MSTFSVTFFYHFFVLCLCVPLCMFVVGLCVFARVFQVSSFSSFKFQEGENHLLESLFAEGQPKVI